MEKFNIRVTSTHTRNFEVDAETMDLAITGVLRAIRLGRTVISEAFPPYIRELEPSNLAFQTVKAFHIEKED